MDAVMLDAALVPLLDTMPEFSFSAELLPTLREGPGLMGPVELSDDVERIDHVVSTDPHVVVRVHRPKAQGGPLPCVYSIHGGGYVLGSYDDGRRPLRRVVPAPRRVSACPSSTGWRPRRPYPGPLDDCYAGLALDCTTTPTTLGIDRDRIGIAGISAGGGLAAALALLARDRGEVPLAFQLLECPMIDDRQATSSSRLDGLPIWSRESNEFGWRSYLGDLYGSDDIPIYAAAGPRRRTSPVSRRRSSSSAAPTGSATRTSTTPCA